MKSVIFIHYNEPVLSGRATLQEALALIVVQRIKARIMLIGNRAVALIALGDGALQIGDVGYFRALITLSSCEFLLMVTDRFE